MKLFDSHCHINDNTFINDLGDVIDRATKNSVVKMLIVGVDEYTSLSAINLANKYDQYASIGFHPHNSNQCTNDVLENLKNLSKHPKVVAWGEIGLDFNRMYSNRTKQESCLLHQLEIANNLKMPIIFHERDTNGRLIEILDFYSHSIDSAVVHCFSGNYFEMKQYLDMGFYIGITGIISMLVRGEKLRSLVNYIPVNKILIETDAPYLTPAPEKNKFKRNEPTFVKTILFKLSEILKKDIHVLADQIWENTCKFFGI